MNQTRSQETSASAVPNGKYVTRMVDIGGGAVCHLRIANFVQGPCATVTVHVPSYSHENNVTFPAQSAQFTLGAQGIADLVKALTDALRPEEVR